MSGTARAQYLNHWHEATFGGGFADAPLLVNEADAPWVKVPHTTFSGRQTVEDDFELIPIPGHTPGATAFLWQRMLFTGDSLWLDGEEWIAAVLEDSDRAAYIDSLELLKTVEFDYLVPWGASADGPWYAPSRPGQARRRHRAAAARRGPLAACSQRSSSALTTNAMTTSVATIPYMRGMSCSVIASTSS